MLTAFNARSIFELTPKDRFRIDSLLAYGTPESARARARCRRRPVLTVRQATS